MHRTIVAFESGTVAWRDHSEWRRWLEPARRPLLEADLRELQLTPLEPAEPTHFACEPGLLGALYVLEGSAQGARMMMHQLRQHGAETGVHFLQAHAHDPRRWRALLARLEQGADTDAAAAEASALRMFTLAEAGFALAAKRT
ncbi:hypothetical protein ACFFGH_01000 [Lysobacter korlensis]|uniref:Heme oxygenase n=1 Tax=Lysobacter korlensis TaxID=553636 RepID=A0ABV6RHG1_9GAMM